MTRGLRWALILIGVFAINLGLPKIVRAATELARINNTVITLEEFNKRYKESTQFYPIKYATKKQLLEDLIKREIGIQEAKRHGIDKDPQVIDRINTVLYNALLEKKLIKEFEAIHVSDDEAKDYYKNNPEIRTSHIFVAVRPNATEKEKTQASEKIQRIQKLISEGKMSFAEIAQSQSEGPTAALGGDIDYQTKERVDPIYYETALKLGSPGKVSGIIRTPFGYHILKVTSIRPWEEADKANAKRMVFEEHRAKIFENYMKSLKGNYKVAVQSNLIKE